VERVERFGSAPRKECGIMHDAARRDLLTLVVPRGERVA
jgi:hypothetical protein